MPANRIAAIAAMLLALTGPIAALAQPTAMHDSWRTMADMDLEAMGKAIKERHIYAVSPGATEWLRAFDEKLASGRRELELVKDFPSYRAVLQHFAVGFQDAHLRLNFAIQETNVEWPGFLARYQAGRFLVNHSVIPGIEEGAEITACDGKPVLAWTEQVADVEIGLPVRLASTRADAAAKLFVDRKNPLYKRPSACVVGGKAIPLAWRAISLNDITPFVIGRVGYHAPTVFVRTIGNDGAWVRLGYFVPGSRADADAFLKLVDEVKGIRDKKYVVLDVRGNPGGPYNWFMAFLRGLYSPAYADYYATARLHIRALYRITPDILSVEKKSHETDIERKQPPDPSREVSEDPDGHAKALARGATYYEGPATPFVHLGPPPPNPVKARVIVLTDTGCGSACIAFLDEIKRFPGVVQVGTDSYVDSRTGTPMSSVLPSGNATVLVPTMTRVGRERGDNIPQQPDIAYDGDISDTPAVQAWILSKVLSHQHAPVADQ